MSRVRDIATSIASRIGTVSNVGQVYDYLRFAKDMERARTLFYSGAANSLRVWEVTRESTTAERIQGFPRWIERHSFVVFGRLGVEDQAATEREFQDLVEAVRDAFRPIVSTGPGFSSMGTHYRVDLIPGAYLDAPVGARSVGHAEFAGALVHACELTFQVVDTASDSTITGAC